MSVHTCPSHSGLSPPGCPCHPGSGWAVKEQLLRGHRVGWGNNKVGSFVCVTSWAHPKGPGAVTHLGPLAPALALTSEERGKVSGPKLPELAGGYLWRSPDPNPRENQCEWVAHGFVQPRTGSSVPGVNRYSSAKWERLSLGLCPMAKCSGCTSRTDALGQLSHGDTCVCP